MSDRPDETSTEAHAAEGTLVGVLMGSDSDYPVMKHALEVLQEFGIPFDVRAMSAHRTPDQVHAFASTARLRGVKVMIAAAGGAAHLAGVVASLTTLPVIGVPIQTKTLGGADSLYSTVQMPPGIPVATMAIGEWGARNAAILAAQILATADEEMQAKLQEFRANMRRKVSKKNEKLQEKARESGLL